MKIFPKINPTKTHGWKALISHQVDMDNVQMKDLFQQDSKRFEKMSIKFDNILFDYSQNIITEETLEKVLQLTEDCKLKDARKAMFVGEKINQTEEALMDGKDVDQIAAELKDSGMEESEIEKLIPFKVFTGNKPTNSLLLKEITPY